MDKPFFPESVLWTAYAISNLLALVMLLGSRWFPTGARLLYCVLFAWAGQYNFRTALDAPWVYYDYADYTFLPVYRWFILGPFTDITMPMILAIAVGQIGIAVTMLLKGSLFRWGCLGGLVFCVAIAPLGLGSAFPATLLMAAGFYRLYRHPATTYFWHQRSRSPSIQPSQP